MIAAIQIARLVGMEPILHYCCRDRNLIGMQSDLLGALRRRAAQLPHHHRRPAQAGRLPRGHRRLRRRRHRPDPPGRQPQPRAGPRRQPHRPAHGPLHRRRGQPRRSGHAARAGPLRPEDRRRRGVRRHPAGLRRWRPAELPGRHGGPRQPPAGDRGRLAAAVVQERRVHEQRGPRRGRARGGSPPHGRLHHQGRRPPRRHPDRPRDHRPGGQPRGRLPSQRPAGQHRHRPGSAGPPAGAAP